MNENSFNRRDFLKVLGWGGAAVALSGSGGGEGSGSGDLVIAWDAYDGRWFQTAASAIPLMTFERNGHCMTADYSAIPDAPTPTLRVVNGMSVGSPTGPREVAVGEATLNEGSTNSLTVTFQEPVPMPPASYVVGAVGPVRGKQYQWAIVTNDTRTVSFVLARNPDTFEVEYGEDVQAALEGLGLTKELNKPRPTTHGTEACLQAYAEL